MKKIISLVLALCLVLASCAVAFADTYTVASPSSHDAVTGHTYKAYQVLSSDYTDSKYVNVEWATDVADAAKTALIALTTDQDSDEDVDFDDFVAALGAASNDDTLSMNVVDYVKEHLSSFPAGVAVTSGTTVLDTGLWVLIDESGAANVDAVNRALLYPSDGTTACTIISKVDAPSSDKSTSDVNDSNTSDSLTNATDVKYADYDIGDSVPYVITATLPGDYADYETYYLKFIDKISTGLTYNNDAKIYYGASDTTGTDIELTKGTSETISGVSYFPYTYEIANTKAETADAELRALTAGAVIRIEYTCTLNSDAVKTVAGNPNMYYIEYSNNPDGTGDGDHGTTPPSIVIILTYDLVVNKVNENEQPLTGADFRLEKWNGTSWVENYATTGEGNHPKKTGDSTGSTFTFEGLDDGKYRLVETATPDGYNSIEPIEFWVKATHSASGIDVQIYNAEGTAVDGNFTVTLTGDITATVPVMNKAGVTLPSTGGIGTTIFYILGGLLVVGAAVILVARRKAQD